MQIRAFSGVLSGKKRKKEQTLIHTFSRKIETDPTSRKFRAQKSCNDFLIQPNPTQPNTIHESCNMTQANPSKPKKL